MPFQAIDRSVWKREPYFQHHFSDVPCTFSITQQLDITNLHTQTCRLYPTMLYLLTKLANRHAEFRSALNKEGILGIHDKLLPYYTIFHRESETFSNLWTEYDEDYAVFCTHYEQDLHDYGTIECLDAKPNPPENNFSISMVPWTSFDGFHLNLQKGYDYLLPLVTMGKFHNANGRHLLPLSLQVHHAVCDGFHASRFLSELQDLINGFTPKLYCQGVLCL